MKTTLILLVISLLIFSAGCGKKPEEISKTEAMSAQPGELVKSSDKKKKNNIVAENYSDKNNLEPINVVSCAVAFADSLDLNALPKEEDVSALTMEEARNILAQNTNFNNEYITRIITECKDFSVVQYFATTLFYKVCNGETHIEYDFAKMKERLPDNFRMSSISWKYKR